MRALAALLLVPALLAGLPAQTCAPGNTLKKNDILPDNPSGPVQYATVRGLCDGEAAMEVLSVGAPCIVRSVSVLFAHYLGVNSGEIAAVDVEIYDGASLVNSRWTLGPMVFQMSRDVGLNLQLTASAINTYALPAALTVRCNSGRPVVGFRMVLNASSGSCAVGYTSNICVDAAGTCTPGHSVLDALGHGPIDPTTYTGFGVRLCGGPIRYFDGAWVLRACIEPTISVNWSGNATPCGFVSLNYLAPGQGGDFYFAMVSGGTSGIPTPWGLIPLAPDLLWQLFMGPARGLLINGVGAFNGTGNAFGALQIPCEQSLRGQDWYAAFFTWRSPNVLVPFQSISAPSAPIQIR